MTERLDVSSLRRVAVFRGLDDAALAELSAAAQRRVYAKRMQIASDAPASACLVAAGAVRLYRVSAMGRETTLLTRREGDLFGFLPDTPDGEPRTFAEALVDHTVVHHLPRSRVLQLVVAHPDSARVAIDQLLRLLADTFDRLEELTCADVKVRLAHTLARLAASDEGHVVWETHETLAWLIGASREKVTKEVCCLRQQGLVTYPSHHHGIRINDLDLLSSM